MPQVVIENPILNTPFAEPQRHFKFTEDGITDEIVAARRISSYFIPIPRPKKKNAKQLAFETEWTADRIQENEFINKVRGRMSEAERQAEGLFESLLQKAFEGEKLVSSNKK